MFYGLWIPTTMLWRLGLVELWFGPPTSCSMRWSVFEVYLWLALLVKKILFCQFIFESSYKKTIIVFLGPSGINFNVKELLWNYQCMKISAHKCISSLLHFRTFEDCIRLIACMHTRSLKSSGEWRDIMLRVCERAGQWARFTKLSYFKMCR